MMKRLLSFKNFHKLTANLFAVRRFSPPKRIKGVR